MSIGDFVSFRQHLCSRPGAGINAGLVVCWIVDANILASGRVKWSFGACSPGLKGRLSFNATTRLNAPRYPPFRGLPIADAITRRDASLPISVIGELGNEPYTNQLEATDHWQLVQKGFAPDQRPGFSKLRFGFALRRLRASGRLSARGLLR